MKNLAQTNEVISGKFYMVEVKGGNTDSYRVLSETPTHYIFSISEGGSVEVFEKAKADIIGIYEVKEWFKSQEEK